MPGFGPIGSTPIASLPGGGGPSPTVFTPLPGYLYLESTGAADVVGVAPGRVYSVARETLQSNTATLFEYSLSRETLQSQEATMYEYVVVREVLMSIGGGTTLQRSSVSILW